MKKPTLSESSEARLGAFGIFSALCGLTIFLIGLFANIEYGLTVGLALGLTGVASFTIAMMNAFRRYVIYKGGVVAADDKSNVGDLEEIVRPKITASPEELQEMCDMMRQRITTLEGKVNDEMARVEVRDSALRRQQVELEAASSHINQLSNRIRQYEMERRDIDLARAAGAAIRIFQRMGEGRQPDTADVRAVGGAMEPHPMIGTATGIGEPWRTLLGTITTGQGQQTPQRALEGNDLALATGGQVGEPPL